jgi:hypothetical protein
MSSPINTNPLDSASPGGYCAACGAALAAGARFCHRCGTPVGQGAIMTPRIDQSSGNPIASALPWGIAFVGLLAIVAYFAAKNMGNSGSGDATATTAQAPTGAGGAPFAAGGAASGGMPPNIENMSANERASRLYIRIMTYAEAGKADSVAFFAPMAMAAHSMIENPSMDERYHYGRIAEVTGDAAVAKAEADTILATQPSSLLGLLLASHAARMTNDNAAAAKFDRKFLDVMPSELAKKLPDYEVHRSEIDRNATDARSSK